MESAKTKTLQVNLIPRARDVIEQIREDSGVPNTEAMARILEWFASLDRKFRLAILTKDEATKAELARLSLVDMIGDDLIKTEVGPLDTLTLEQLVKLQHRVTDQIGRLGKMYQGELRKRVEGDAKKK